MINTETYFCLVYHICHIIHIQTEVKQIEMNDWSSFIKELLEISSSVNLCLKDPKVLKIMNVSLESSLQENPVLFYETAWTLNRKRCGTVSEKICKA